MIYIVDDLIENWEVFRRKFDNLRGFYTEICLSSRDRDIPRRKVELGVIVDAWTARYY